MLVQIMDLESVRKEIRAALPLPWYDEFPGLTLQLGLLEELGASHSFLMDWELGKPLLATHRHAAIFNSHPSLIVHDKWAEAEWSRLEQLGKI